MLQAPAWQPPLPQEAPKAPEVKAEPQQQVMSEYERFMAEVRWPPRVVILYCIRLSTSEDLFAQDPCVAGTDSSLSTLTIADGAGAPLNVPTDDIHPGVMAPQGSLPLTRGPAAALVPWRRQMSAAGGRKESAASLKSCRSSAESKLCFIRSSHLLQRSQPGIWQPVPSCVPVILGALRCLHA